MFILVDQDVKPHSCRKREQQTNLELTGWGKLDYTQSEWKQKRGSERGKAWKWEKYWKRETKKSLFFSLSNLVKREKESLKAILK